VHAASRTSALECFCKDNKISRYLDISENGNSEIHGEKRESVHQVVVFILMLSSSKILNSNGTMFSQYGTTFS